MEHWQSVKFKSDAYWTDDEAIKANSEATKKWLFAQTEDEKAEALSLMRETQVKINNAAEKALFMYIDDRAGDYEALLSDAEDMIEQITVVDFIAEEIGIAYRELLRKNIEDDLGDLVKEKTDAELWQLVSERVSRREQVDNKDLFDTASASIRHFYLSEQYEAARFTFENQSNKKYNYAKHTLEEYNAFTCKISELAEAQIQKIIDENGGIYCFVDLYFTQREPTDPATPAAGKGRKKQSYLSPVSLPAAFHTPNSYIANEFPFWTREFYKENTDGQLTFLPDAGRLPLNVSGNNSNPVNIYVALNYEGDITEDGTTTISYNKARIAGFDLAVLDAICSFMEHGTDSIYVSAIDNFLKGGKTQNNKVSKKRQDRIILALRKLSGTRIYLDIRNDLNTKYGDVFAEGIYDGAMLEYDGLKATTYAGVETYIFHVKDLPAIYKYSKAKGNIVQFPTVLLDTGDRAEENIIPLKKELLKHITLINKRIYNNHNISISNLYKRADVPEPTGINRKQKSRDVARFKNWLEYWKTYDYIKDFSVQGDTITITPNYITSKNKNQSME